MTTAPGPYRETTAIFGSYVLTRDAGGQTVLRDQSARSRGAPTRRDRRYRGRRSNPSALQPLFDPRRALNALANRVNIDLVIVDGRVLIEAGTYIRAAEAAITAVGSAVIKKIWDLPEARAAFNA